MIHGRRFTLRSGLLGVLAVLSATPAMAQTGWGIGVQADGGIFFCDRGRSTVWRIDRTGARTAALTGVNCRAVVTAPDGSVLGETSPSDITATRGVGIWQIQPNGTRQWLLAQTMTPPTDRWLVQDAEQREYAWTGVGTGSPRSEIVSRDPSGLTSVIAGGAWGASDGFGAKAAFGNVTGLALAPDGTLLVADSGNIRRISRLHVVRTEAVGVITDSRLGLLSAAGLWDREQGLATDLHGNAVVVDPEAGRIIHVDRNGVATPIWEPAGLPQRVSDGRWGWRPVGVAMMGRTYYVLDEWMGPALVADLIGSPRLSQVDENGTVTRIAAVGDWTVRAASASLLLVVLSTLVAAARRRRA
jgi:hypothetical protein